MGATRPPVKKLAYAIAKVSFVIVVGLGAIVGFVLYSDWSAERKAQAFCDEIDLGSDISTTIVKAKDRKILQGSYQGYSFYFPGNMFTKAVCEVSVDKNQKVASKHSKMEYD
jgi:hypothetical protein